MPNFASLLRTVSLTGVLGASLTCSPTENTVAPPAPENSSGSPGVSATSEPSSNDLDPGATLEGPPGAASATSAPSEGLPTSSGTASLGSSSELVSLPDDSTVSSAGPMVDESSSAPTSETGVRVVDGTLVVDGKPFPLRGVNWNPVPRGGQHPQDLDFEGYVEQDASLMQAAGINVVRTYEHLSDPAVLDTLLAHDIRVFTTVYGWWQDDPAVVTQRVDAVKHHPAVIGYVLGNEWNYNQLYANGAISTEQARDQINAAAALVKQADPNRPVTTIYGELGGLEGMVDSMPDIDLWGINTYRGLSFGDLFPAYAAVSGKPMFIGEFGADAYNALIDAYDPDSQAEATSALLSELSGAVASKAALGGFIFEWADEWWKDGSGSPSEQDEGGIAPGGGPHPDQTFNEEWWGLVDVDRNPRAAYDATRAHYAP